MSADRHPPASWGLAWLALGLALAVHVADEALHHFLSLWNPLVRAARERVLWAPLPTFTFGVWLAGLILLVVVLLTLTGPALRGARWLRPPAYLLGVLMLLNGLGHLAASVYLDRFAPGVYSSPLLLAGSVWLLVRPVRRCFESAPVTLHRGLR